MNNLFVYGKNSHYTNRIFLLANDLTGINIFMFSEIYQLRNALKNFSPDALLYAESEYSEIISETDPGSLTMKHIVISDSLNHSGKFHDGVVCLPEDFNKFHLLNALKDSRKQKHDLIYSAKMLDLIIQHIPLAMFWKDQNFKYIGCDPIFCRDRGLPEDFDVYGLTDFDLFPKEVALKGLLTDQEVLETGLPLLNYEEEIMDSDGHIEYLRKSKIPIRDEKGNVMMIMGLYEKITDQKIMQEHLKNEKQYLRMLMDNIPDTIYFKDRNSKFVKINKAQAAILGLENPDDAIGKMDADFFDPEHAMQAYLDEQKLMKNGLPLVNKLEYIHTAFGYRYVTATKIPLLDESGNCIGMVGVSRDVTREHQAEEELKQEKELMNLLMDNIPDRIYFKDKNSRFIRANRALARMFGRENAEELYGKTDFDFHDPVHAKLAFEDEKQLMKEGKPIIGKIESHMLEVNRVWESTTKIPLFDKNHEVMGLVGISRDFTKQKQLETALEKEKDLLQNLMDNVPDFIYFKDLDSKYFRINKAIADSLKLKDVSEAYGKSDHDFYPKEVADGFLEDERELFATGNAIVGKIEKSCLLDGTTIWVSTTKIPLKDENGKITGLVGISRDVTVQELTKQSYLTAKEKAEEANKAKSLFLANMSHEIRTPMNGVIGMADILKRTNLDDVQKEYLDIIMKSGGTLLSIINDILDFSKIESGKMMLESAPINIRNIIEEVADIQIIHANEKSIDLLTFVDSDIPEFVNGDYVRLKQIITNLVNNAIKFTSKGEVYVSAEYNGMHGKKHEVLFRVKDSGIGIAKNDQKKLFQSFSQVDTSTTRRFGGTGLGLAISQRLVHEMGGKFKLESEVGKGSVFSFTAKFDPSQEIDEASVQFKNISFKNMNALIVDDTLTNRKIFREYLEKWQMNVYEAVDGIDALGKLREFHEKGIKADIVLVDYQMAGMDGLELAGRVKEEPALQTTPLILLSSVTDIVQQNNIKKYGFEYYLNKPVKLKQLFTVIAAVVGKLKNAKVNDEDLEQQITAFRDKHFLIAEDNLINMKVGQFALKDVSEHVFAAYNGLETIEIFKREKIDFILMDIQMPVMNGVEATLKIREIEKQKNTDKPVKIIAMTANTMREDVEKCLEAGMDAFLGKPFKVADLVNVLKEIESAE